MSGRYSTGDRVQVKQVYQSDYRIGIRRGMVGTVLDKGTKLPDVHFDDLNYHSITMHEDQLSLVAKESK